MCITIRDYEFKLSWIAGLSTLFSGEGSIQAWENLSFARFHALTALWGGHIAEREAIFFGKTARRAPDAGAFVETRLPITTERFSIRAALKSGRPCDLSRNSRIIPLNLLLAIIPDGFYRTGLHGLFALALFFIILRLF